MFPPLSWTETILNGHQLWQCHHALTPNATFFFHEYGRRVGMVPRSSLKEGKNSLMVEKRTRTTKTTQNQTNHSPQAESLFFPRVRTPCGHGAQVIVEGREEKTDGGEKNEDPKKKPTQKPNTQARRLTPPSCSLPYTLGETCETETSDN